MPLATPAIIWLSVRRTSRRTGGGPAPGGAVAVPASAAGGAPAPGVPPEGGGSLGRSDIGLLLVEPVCRSGPSLLRRRHAAPSGITLAGPRSAAASLRVLPHGRGDPTVPPWPPGAHKTGRGAITATPAPRRPMAPGGGITATQAPQQ